MRRTFSSGEGQGQERKEILQAVQEQAERAGRLAVKAIREAFLEAEVRAKRGREKGETRRIGGQERPMDWHGGHGGCQNAHPLSRDGQDQPRLWTSWGTVSELRVPMVACQVCHQDGVSHVAILETHPRFWMDLDHPVLSGRGFSERLRQRQER